MNDNRGVRVLEERKRLKLTKIQAAERCGVHRNQWARYEKDEQKLDGEVLRNFIALGADGTYILTGMRGAPYSTPTPQEQAFGFMQQCIKQASDNVERLGLSGRVAMAVRDLLVSVDVQSIPMLHAALADLVVAQTSASEDGAKNEDNSSKSDKNYNKMIGDTKISVGKMGDSATVNVGSVINKQ